MAIKATAAKKSQVKKPAVKKTTSSNTRTATKKPPVAKKKPAARRKKAAVRKASTALPKTPKTKPRSKTKAAAKEKSPVVLPKRMSMRAQEKALVLSTMFERDFYPVAMHLSRVAGLCFVTIGAFLTFVSLSDDLTPKCGDYCGAQVAATTDLLSISEAATPANTLTALATLPPTITSTLELPIEVTNATDVTASLDYVPNSGQKQIVPLDVTSLGNDKYSIEIRAGALPSADYTLKAEVRFTGFDRYQTFIIGSFVVPQSTTADNPTGITPVVATGTPTEIVSEETIRQEEIQESIETGPVLTVFAPNMASQVVTVQVPSATQFSEVELFVRAISGVNNQFVGRLTSGGTDFRLNTLNLPNGTYELFARGATTAGTVTSKSVVVEVFNRESISAGENSLEQERQLLTISRELNEDLYDSFQGGESVDDSVVELAEERLRADEGKVETLFTAYAAAQQAGDESMIAAAKESIENYRTDIVAEALSDESDRYIADELDQTLERRLGKLEDKINRFEAVRRQRTENDSSIDTDGDGISDIDETVLYQTDPTAADTDGDGFTDGAEIVKGFNPTDATVEAPIVYESPKEVIGVVKTDKLIVHEVVPDVVLETSSSSERIQTTVRGQALPNSFVTLYVFSTPTIVTVRTDETGAFEYTFTKELEDGEHQVFAALTDNTGEIIAQSQAFTFVKEARAFTTVDAEDMAAQPESITYADVTSSNNSYRVAVGMAVLAFGIILILLGVGLRGNKPEEEAVIMSDETV